MYVLGNIIFDDISSSDNVICRILILFMIFILDHLQIDYLDGTVKCVIWTQKEKAPAYNYTLLVSRLGKKLVLRDPEQAQTQSDLLDEEIVFEISYIGHF